MSRKKRLVKKVFKVFCEGDTEYNYFEYIRKNKKVSLVIRPINMKGGGYANFLDQIKGDANSNCLAKFIVIDGDRALSFPGELDALKEIIDYCKKQNSSKRTPYILIIDYPNFEYVACLHTYAYKGQKVEQYIKRELGYRDVDAFKADDKVFKVLVESGKGSIEQLIKSVNHATAIVNNDFSINKSKYEIFVKSTINMSNLGKKGTNFDDFYKVLGELGVVI